MDAHADSMHHQFPRSTRRAPATSLDFSELGSIAAPSSICRDRTIDLGDDEVDMLSALGETLLARLTAAYETHAFVARGVVDKKRWKSLKKREQLTVYKERHSDAPASPEDAMRDSMADAPSDSARVVPQLLLTGTLPGRVEDALYGLASPTSLAMKFRSAYTQDTSVLDADVLATIEGPSADDPFRFLGLKYVLQSHPASATTPFVKKRDVVFLEATGTTTLPSGDRVGYSIVHSVELHSRARLLRPSASASAPVVRAKTSLGTIFRQRTGTTSTGNDSVDVFARGYYDPQGDMLQFLALNVAAEQLLLTATSSLECAELKKLSYAAHQRTRQRRRTATVVCASSVRLRATTGAATMLHEMAAAAQEVDAEASSSGTLCAICSRKCGKMLQRSGAACTLCTRMVCSRCSVTKKLSFTRDDQDDRSYDPDYDRLVADLERSGMSRSRKRSSAASVKSALSSALSVSTSSSSVSALTQSRVARLICQKPMHFCVPCLVASNAQSAVDVAVEELLEHQARAHAHCAAATPLSGSYQSSASVTRTPRQVLAAMAIGAGRDQQQQQLLHTRHSTRSGSVQQHHHACAGSSSTPRFTITGITHTPPAASASSRASKRARPKAFSTSSTASSTTSSVVLYEEPSAAS